MSVPAQTPSKEYIANGTTTAFPLEFNCDKAEYLIVTLNGEDAPVGSWTLANDTVTFNVAPLNGVVVNLERNTPFQRTTNYQLYDNSFRPSAVNKDFDLIWWKLQELGVADWILGNRISALKNYVDRKDDELKAYLMEEIRKQGVALDQLDEYCNYLMQRLAQIAVDKGWEASFVVDASGKTQQEVNDRGGSPWYNKPDGYSAQEKALIINGAGVRSIENNNTTDPNTDMSKWAFIEHLIFKSRDEMLAYANPKTGQVAHLLSVHAPNFALLKPQDGDGFFIYDESKSNDNNGGTVCNGWVRQYAGDVDISWFGAQQGADASPFIEEALKISKSIVIRGNYTLETICGIPDQNNYSPTVISIRGENQATLTVNCPAGAVFTSAAAKLNPTSTSDIYTGKINVSDINFIGTTIANSVIFNGDRLYNMKIHHNNFHGSVTIIKAVVKRLANRNYSQSVDINNNHMALVHRVIEADRAYNFNFSFNACENCIGGIYIGIDAPFDPTGMSVSIFRNLWESGGMILKVQGGLVAGSVSKNYFESNNIADAATDKCQIYINRTGTGAGHSGGLVFDSNFFSGSASVAGYCDVRIIGTPDVSGGTTKNAITAPAVFIGNWSENERLVDNPSAILIGNRIKDRALMLNAYTPQEARVSFFSGFLNKAVTTNPVRFMTIDTRPCLTNSAASANFKASMDVMLHFTTSGAVNTATVGFKLDLMVFAPYGAGTPPKAGLKASMSGFVQSSGSDKITETVQMGAVVSSPTIAVVDNGDGTYHLDLSTFANYSAPNWGNITNVRVTYNMQGSGYIPGSYSSLNLLGIS
ncbi:hypothetical protein L2694_14395 [Acinetobacter baumannii]|uniref:hypothetical protein n=1 Tax=Acinetobacter baumannii TaxID=470 RepID=UPI00214935BD|nr:hypothetical protein [Acinetobacter baumannii]MCR0117978.1 hypothetical protein [Acinetobacter baumannii]